MATRVSRRRHSGGGQLTVWVGFWVLLVTIIIRDTVSTRGLFVLGFTASGLSFSSQQINIGFTRRTSVRLRTLNSHNNELFGRTRSRHHRGRIVSRLSSSTRTVATPSVVLPWTSTPLDPTQILPETTVHAIEQLVQARGTARWEGNYEQADQLKAQILQTDLPAGIELCLEDVPRSEGGGSVWKLMYQASTLLVDDHQQESTASDSKNSTSNNPSVLQLAHAALGWAVSCSQTMVPRSEKQKQLQTIVEQAKESLRAWKYIQEQQQQNPQPFSVQPIDNTSNDESLINEEESTTTSPVVAADAVSGWRAVETSLRGRKAADAAFWFALAGTTDAELFDLLALVCTKELHRFGAKPTCRAKDIAQMMDRFAAAGIRSGQHPGLEAIAKQCLELKQQEQQQQQQQDNAESLSHSAYSGLLELHSDRTLLMLWKFSARQKKQQSFLQSARKHWEHQQRKENKGSGGDTIAAPPSIHGEPPETFSWNDRFEDPTKPLILDVGCGLGISLLGLASLPECKTHRGTENNGEGSQETAGVQILNQDELKNCNMLGVDLSGLAIGYAQGIAERWDLGHRLQFEVDNAEALLQKVLDSYPGPVSLCLIQFPTPYRLPQAPSKNSETSGAVNGNSQLPDSAYEGFMVSPNLLQLVQEVLSNNKYKPNIKRNDAIAGKLLLQSNCEDVALWMQQTAVQGGYKSSIASIPLDIAQNDNLPQRTKNWIAIGGERAVGKFWNSEPLLPQRGSTETEVACRLNNTPVHRCLLTLSG